MEPEHKGGAMKVNKMKALVKKVKEFIIPPTKKDKVRRAKQFKDVGIFLASIAIIYVFQKKIEKLITVNPEELQKMTQQMSGQF